VRLHQKQRFEIQTFMRTILDVSGDYVVYKDDWSDGKVGEKFNVPATTIAGTRAETFGKLRSHSYAPKALDALTERVERLENRIVEVLETQVKFATDHDRLTGHMQELVDIVADRKKNGEDHHYAS